MRRCSFSLRLTLFSTALIALSVGLGAVISYDQSKKSLEKSLANELLSMVNSLAPLIDGDLHQLIFINEEGKLVFQEEFDLIRNQLVKVRNSNKMTGPGSPMYTMRKAHDFDATQELEFVVMTNKDDTGRYFVGNRYKAQKHNLEALQGTPSATGIYSDSEGIWISAAAPIFDSAKNVVGFLQADRHVDFFYQEARKQAVTILLSAIFSIIIGGILAVFFARSLTNPIKSLVSATNMLETGNLDYRLAIQRHDEIGDLSASFNRMATALDQMTQAQQRRLAELSALHAIGLVISSTLDVDRLIDLALDAVTEHLGYDRARLLLVDSEKQTLVHGRVSGASEEIRAKFREMEIPLQEDSGFHAKVALSGEPVLVEDMEKVADQAYRPVANLLRTRSFLAVPLKIEDRVLGVMSVDNSRTNRTLTEADQRLLTTLGNQMAIAITNALSYRQIAQLNIGLEEKVQERTEALQLQQEQLREVNSQLERANRHKSEFLANMSHELRTPLNAIIGFSEVLLEKMFGELNAKQEEYLNDIFTSGKYLLNLINDILDLSKIEAGKLELEPGVLDLRQLLEGSLVMVKERALAHGITLSLEIADDLDTVIGDERKVKQILFNLLSNAVKFTPDQGRVGIRSIKAGAVVQTAVWDTGIGIAAADQQRIFEAFQQVGQGLTGKTEGTGLGLALTKQLVELHGGAIWVESRPGGGSTFTFTLPLASAMYQTPLPTVQEETAPEGLTAAACEAPRVLVIEDEPKAANLLCIYLTEAGYTVDIARDGAEGLQKVKRLLPDAIILDVLLPKVDGWAFLTQVKADPATKDVPVIIVSIIDQKGKGFALGAADYLVKPVQKEELLRKLDAYRLVSKVQTEPVKILVIDDDPKAIELLATVLASEGFRVLKAYSGQEGIEVATAERPDLIILDLLMPGMNGFETLDIFEASPAMQRLPIIIYTVKQLTAEEKQRLKGRIAQLIQKQEFTQRDFVGMVREVLQQTLGGGRHHGWRAHSDH